ncbi:MAG: hypothetical protein AAB973_03280, partial [Patescibacteria group bacterium]
MASDREREMLSKRFFDVSVGERRLFLEQRGKIFKRWIEDDIENMSGTEKLVAIAMLGLFDGANGVLERQIVQNLPAGRQGGKSKSWYDSDRNAAGRMVESLDHDPVWKELAKVHPAYEKIRKGLKSLSRSKSELAFRKLETQFTEAVWELYKAGLPLIFVPIDDWLSNPGRKSKGARKMAEVDIIVGRRDYSPGLPDRLESLTRNLAHEFRHEKWSSHRMLIEWMMGAGFQVFSATTGFSLWDKGMVLATNLPKTRETVSRVWRMAGIKSQEVVKYLNTDVAVHELAHNAVDLKALYSELGADAIAARKCLEMIIKKEKGWKNMTLTKMVTTILGESAAQAMEKTIGNANNDGYPFSGVRMVNMMFETGVVEFKKGKLEVNLKQLSGYMGKLKEVEGWLVANKNQKIRALGDLSPKAKKFMRQ